MPQFKTCPKCNQTKDISCFYKNKTRYDGVQAYCIKCSKEKLRTKEEMILNIYYGQRKSSKKRNNPMPTYSKEEFLQWVLNQDNFDTIFNNWVNSGYKMDLVPSIDRLDDYKGYSLDNIQLMTWIENKQKGYDDVKNGINNKKSRSVFQYSLQNEFIREFKSIRMAARSVNGLHSTIIKNCVLKCSYAYGFIWKYEKI